MRDAKPNDPRPARGGWSPGESYTCKCKTCGCWFIGAKRSFQCADCAYAGEFEAAAPKPTTTATQARIEELVRLAYEATSGADRVDWGLFSDRWMVTTRADFLSIARTLYAAAMRDAAGVATARADEVLEVINKHGLAIAELTARAVECRNLATALETIAKEASDADHG